MTIFSYQIFGVKIIWISFRKSFSSQGMHEKHAEPWGKTLITTKDDQSRSLATQSLPGHSRI
jgi:hypothetical protein